VAEGGGLLNRYRVVKPYRGFESLRLRQRDNKVPSTDMALLLDHLVSATDTCTEWRWGMCAITEQVDVCNTRRRADMPCPTSKRRFVPERSPDPIRSSAARLRSVRSVRKSRVRATKRNCAGGRSLALLVACEITQPRVAVGSAL
jgi:hypothetical protein